MTVTVPDIYNNHFIYIKSCPFCGKNPVIRYRLENGYAHELVCYISIKCDSNNCGAISMSEYFDFRNDILQVPSNIAKTVEKVAERWNKRV